MNIISNKNSSLWFILIITLIYISIRSIFVDNTINSLNIFKTFNKNGTNFRIMIFILLISFITEIFIYKLVYKTYKFVNTDEIIYSIFLSNKEYIKLFRNINYDNVKTYVPINRTEKVIYTNSYYKDTELYKGPSFNLSPGNLFYYVNQNEIRGIKNTVFNEFKKYIKNNPNKIRNDYNIADLFLEKIRATNTPEYKELGKIEILNLSYKKISNDNNDYYIIDEETSQYNILEKYLVEFIRMKLRLDIVPSYNEILFSDITNSITFIISLFVVLYTVWILFTLFKNKHILSATVVLLIIGIITIFQFKNFIPDQFNWLQITSESDYILNNEVFNNKDFTKNCIN